MGIERTEGAIKKRNSLIELIRFLAACEIVCYHVGAPWAREVRVLPIFLIFSIVFAINSHLALSEQLKKAWNRIMIPWFFWSAVYLTARLARAFIDHASIRSEFEWWMLLAGGAGVLWYLPFAFGSGMGVLYIARRCRLNLTGRSSHILALSGGLLLLISAIVYPAIYPSFPIAQWVYLAPAILIAPLYSRYYFRFQSLIFARGVWILVCGCIGALALNLKVGSAYCLAVCLCSFAFSFKPPGSNAFLNYLGKLSYGIYLVHILVRTAGTYCGFPEGSNALLLFTILFSILAASVLLKTPIRRFI